MFGDARILGNAKVSGRALVFGRSRIDKDAEIFENLDYFNVSVYHGSKIVQNIFVYWEQESFKKIKNKIKKFITPEELLKYSLE